jgi:hypothetical protein
MGFPELPYHTMDPEADADVREVLRQIPTLLWRGAQRATSPTEVILDDFRDWADIHRLPEASRACWRRHWDRL